MTFTGHMSRWPVLCLFPVGDRHYCYVNRELMLESGIIDLRYAAMLDVALLSASSLGNKGGSGQTSTCTGSA